MAEISSIGARGSPLNAGVITAAQLATQAKLQRLLDLAKGRRKALILPHDNPDPDSIASAIALGFLLSRRAGLSAQVAYGGIIGRAENLALVKVLRLPVSPVSQVAVDEYDLLALVDTQPSIGNHPLAQRHSAEVVIDHHPLREGTLTAPFADVGGDYGATSTMLVEYLRSAQLDPSIEVATALFYGIKADTRDLGRQTTQSDIDAYLWLFPRVEKTLLAKIEHPDLPARYFRLYHSAIERAKVYASAIVTDLGQVYSPDMVAEVAERMMFLEGMRWSLAFGAYGDRLFLSLRTNDQRMNAGHLIREICQDLGGSAGGHGSMAGARLPLRGDPEQRQSITQETVRRFLVRFGVEHERPVPLLAAENA